MTTRLDCRGLGPVAIVLLLGRCQEAFPKVVTMDSATVRLDNKTDQATLCRYLELSAKRVISAQEEAEASAANKDIEVPGILFKGEPGYDQLLSYRVVQANLYGEGGLYATHGPDGPKVHDEPPRKGYNYVPDFDDEVTCVLVQHFGAQQPDWNDTSPLAAFLREQLDRFAEDD